MNSEYRNLAQDPSMPEQELDKKDSKVLDFFNENKDFFDIYSGESGISVKKSPEGLDTFAIDLTDLKKVILYGDPKYFTDIGYSERKAVFAFLHEFEHLRKTRDLLLEKNGEKIWQRHHNRMKGKERLKLFDNVWDDVRMNRTVISRAPSQADVKTDLYRENLFIENNFLELPKHLQFAYCLSREINISDEKCIIADDVREEIENLRQKKSKMGLSLLDYASRPDIPPSLQMELQEKLFEPIYEKFYQEDEEQKRNEKKDQMSGEGKSDQEIQESLPQNSEDFFKDEYKEFFDKNPDKALSDKIFEQAVKDYMEHKEENKKNEKNMVEEAYALEHGVTKDEIDAYQKDWSEIEEIKNPETNEYVVEELRSLFRKIIAERIKPKQKPKLPNSDGEKLALPAEAVVAIKAGIEDPEVWETIQEKEQPKELYGDFDVHIVSDRSFSMNESDDAGSVKKIEQKKAVILLNEVLKEFSDDLDEVRSDLQYDLNVRTENRSFGSESENEILKPLSKELTEKQRVAVYKKLDSTKGGSTKDFLALESLNSSITEEDIEKMKSGKLKKIVLVLSDGDSSDPKKTQDEIKKLRKNGVIIRGIGITKSAESIKKTYKPNAIICERADQLAIVLAELLKEYLSNEK